MGDDAPDRDTAWSLIINTLRLISTPIDFTDSNLEPRPRLYETDKDQLLDTYILGVDGPLELSETVRISTDTKKSLAQKEFCDTVIVARETAFEEIVTVLQKYEVDYPSMVDKTPPLPSEIYGDLDTVYTALTQQVDRVVTTEVGPVLTSQIAAYTFVPLQPLLSALRISETTKNVLERSIPASDFLAARVACLLQRLFYKVEIVPNGQVTRDKQFNNDSPKTIDNFTTGNFTILGLDWSKYQPKVYNNTYPDFYVVGSFNKITRLLPLTKTSILAILNKMPPNTGPKPVASVFDSERNKLIDDLNASGKMSNADANMVAFDMGRFMATPEGATIDPKDFFTVYNAIQFLAQYTTQITKGNSKTFARMYAGRYVKAFMNVSAGGASNADEIATIQADAFMKDWNEPVDIADATSVTTDTESLTKVIKVPEGTPGTITDWKTTWASTPVFAIKITWSEAAGWRCVRPENHTKTQDKLYQVATN
jgi:hypothetical protein